ncbi:MAG: peptide chain release factor N(5)-glutamine methyltransferase [Gammaproteobacteria bacterium]|nr:peptide chain release factor N(5)-glutamine methyltransferase [Gammaproteobacteria bacterium]MDH5694861.1 peptide chain release factor N(5)-glutamine methyltransferase [Gammaproteobacteria bacterium]
MSRIFSLTPNISVSHLLRTTINQQFHHLDTPRLEAELLLSHAMKVSRTTLHTYPERKVSREQYTYFQELVTRRLEGEPMAYLLGEQEFWSLNLKVNHHVLIPRPETEHTVEMVLELSAMMDNPHIADLGTGSGAIALALAFERPDAIIIGADLSQEALNIARKNAERLSLRNILFKQTNWLQGLEEKRFDIIVSNPPYIAGNDPHLKETSLPYEPKMALTSGETGLEALTIIINTAKHNLVNGGWLVVEHGYDQQELVYELFLKAGYVNLGKRSDIGGNDRVFYGQFLVEN